MPNPWDVGSARCSRSSAFPRSRRRARASPGRSAGATTTSRSTRRWRTCARSPAASTCRSTPTSRAASRSSRRGRRQRRRAPRHGHRRPLDRGLHRRSRAAALRVRRSPSSASARRGRRIDASGTGVLLTGAPRASSPAGPISRRRSAGSTAYAEAGADCLYAPGLRTKSDIAAVVSARRARSR